MFANEPSGAIVLTALVAPGVDAHIELFTADARKELLESASGRSVEHDQVSGESHGPLAHPTNASFQRVVE